MPPGVYNRNRKDKLSCPECGRRYSPSFLQAHRRKVHQAYGGFSGSHSRQAKAAVIQREVEANGKLRFHHEENFVLLSDNNGSLWIAERIK